MRKLLLAVAALGLFAVDVSAQPYGDGRGGRRTSPPSDDSPAGSGHGVPPAWRHRQPYGWCQAKASRLHEFEYRMQQDGRVSRDEARIASALRGDLASSCGNGRWHPQRGWHYR